MPDLSKVKYKSAEQPPEERVKNFGEVTHAYTDEEARAEAGRCLNCKNHPCVSGCPVGVPIPDMMQAVAEGRIADAYEIISSANALPAISGRVCPQENQCEGQCVRGRNGEPVAIGKIERYIADWAAANNISNVSAAPKNGKKVAVCGAGPAGLTCAGELARKGYEVTVYEALHTAGGVLSYGIPEFRLPKEVVNREVKNLEKMGVNIECNVIIGKTLAVDELFEMGYDAVFIGTGAGLPQLMKIPGEGSVGVYTANEYLTRINLMKAYEEDSPTPVIHAKKAIVVGGGNVAMDAARCARRMGAEVHVVYRRSDAELPARKEEVHHAREEGIIFDTLTAPVEILSDDKYRVTGMKCVKMELGEPDASGRRRPIQIPGSEFGMDADIVIIAIGTTPNPLIIRTTPGLEATRIGGIAADEECATSREHVYAGGDITSGAATVILAMGAGKRAAASIDAELVGKK